MRAFIVFASLLAIVVSGSPALAQAPGTDADRSPDQVSAPPLGTLPTLSQGLYVDLQVGTFFSVNINSDATLAGGSVGNAQAYVGLGVGYDLTRNMIVGGNFAYGASSGACFDPQEPGECGGAKDFSVIMLNGYFGYLHGIKHQWYLGAKVLGGMALLTPEPTRGAGDLAIGGNAGLMLTTEYHTHLDRFILGLDVGGTFVLGPGSAQFPGIAIYPRLKYVF